MKRIFYLLGIILLASTILFSGCKKDEGDDDKIPTSKTIESGSIKKDEDAKGNLQRGSFVLNVPANLQNSKSFTASSITVSNASKANVGDAAQDKHDMFVSKDDNRATGTYMWTFFEFNNESVVDNMWFQFEDDGTYIVYDFDSNDWWWGYYYIDEAMNYIVFDADEDDPDSENASWWRIDHIQSISSETGENDVTCTDKEGNTFVIGSFLNNEWEEEEPYTEAEYESILLGKTWVIESTYYESYEDTSSWGAWEDDFYLTALEFLDNNEVIIYDARFLYEEMVNDSTDSPSISSATYTISSEGILSFDFGDGDTFDMPIDYSGNYFGNSGDDNFFSSSFSEYDDDDGYYYVDYFWMEQSLFESEYYSIGYPMAK